MHLQILCGFVETAVIDISSRKRAHIVRAVDWMLCLGFCRPWGGDGRVQSPVEEEGGPRTRRSRSISSPLPLSVKEFDTPSAFASAGGDQASGLRDDFEGGEFCDIL